MQGHFVRPCIGQRAGKAVENVRWHGTTGDKPAFPLFDDAGRADDVFKSAGYRIGPGEIENCLLGHDAVANVAVVPKPDTERGALVKAYVVLTPEYAQRDQAELIHAAIPDAGYSLIRNAGHLLHEEKPDKVMAALLEFIPVISPEVE